jgi:hypothetical protein
MPVNSLLKNLAFKPDEIVIIAEAYDSARRQLHLEDRTDPLCLMVAKKIIELAEAGERDPSIMCRDALRELMGQTDAKPH